MILYPNLLKYHVKTNPIWMSILERISIGDAPYGTHIYNGILYYNQHNIQIAESKAEDVLAFFIEHVGIKLNYSHFNSWKEIKRKVVKDNLIMDYVSRTTDEYQLVLSQSKYLLSLIHLYITLKKITPNDIILDTSSTKDNENIHTFIKSINGLMINGTWPNIKIYFETVTATDDIIEDDEDSVDYEEPETL